jgi:hypothetical protein
MANSRICSGQTIPGNTNWKPYANGRGIFVDIDTSACHFATTPVYITSIGGTGDQWGTTGASSVYMATLTGFRIYIRWVDYSPLTPLQASSRQWHINWIGMEI